MINSKQINIYSNFHNLESQRKSHPELLDLVNCIESYDLNPVFRNAYTQPVGKDEKNIMSLENYSYPSMELCRIASMNPTSNICVLFFPKIFVSGHLLFIAQYLISKKVKLFCYGLDKLQYDKLRLTPSLNIKELSPSVMNYPDYENLIFDRGQFVLNLKNLVRNIIWTQMFPADFNKALHEKVLTANLSNDVNEIVAKTFLTREILVNLVMMNNIITRYRLPLEDMMNAFINDNKNEIKKNSRMLSFFLYNKTLPQQASMLANIFEKNKLKIASNATSFDLFESVFHQIWEGNHSLARIDALKQNFIRFLIKSRFNEDALVANRLKLLPDIDDYELKERNTFRGFILNFDQILEKKDNTRGLNNEEIKILLKEISRFLHKENIFNSKSNVKDFQTVFSNITSKDPFFESEIFKKIIQFFIDNPFFQESSGLKHIVPKIKFNREEIEQIVNFFRTEYFLDSTYFKQLKAVLSENKFKPGNAKLTEVNKTHFQKKIRILPEFDYVFLCNEKLSEQEKFMVILGKCQLSFPFLANISEPVLVDDPHKLEGIHNKVLIQSIEKHPIKIQFKTSLLIEAHRLFIEKAILKEFKIFMGNSDRASHKGFGEVDAGHDKGMLGEIFSTFYNKIINENFILLGYHQLYGILAKKSGLTEKQIELFGYVKDSTFSEEPFYFNQFLDADQEQSLKKAQMLPTIYGNIIHNYTNFLDDLKKSIDKERDEIVQRSLKSIYEDLIKNDRNALNNFREKNEFNSTLVDIMKKLFHDNFQDLSQKKDTINLNLSEKYNFLKFFIKDVVLELGDTVYRFVINYDFDNKLDNKFIELLDSLYASVYKNEFDQMLNLYKYIVYVNKYLCNMQHLAGLKMTHDLMVFHTFSYNSGDISDERSFFLSIPDEKKMIICSHDQTSRINAAKILNKPNDKRKVVESFSSMNESLAIYVNIFDEIKEWKDNMLLFNEVFSLIPNIKFAPQQLKLFRQNIKYLCEILHKRFEEQTVADVTNIEKLCFQNWNYYTDLIKLETHFPSNYRFFDMGLKQFKFRLGSAKFENFLVFLKNGHSRRTTNQKLLAYFTCRMEQSIALGMKLSKKEHIFVVPFTEIKSATLDCVKNLKIIKGVHSHIYVNNKNSDVSSINNLTEYISSQYFINFTK